MLPETPVIDVFGNKFGGFEGGPKSTTPAMPILYDLRGSRKPAE